MTCIHSFLLHSHTQKSFYLSELSWVVPSQPVRTISSQAEDKARGIYNKDGGGWKLVRRVKLGTSWHPATDHLSGTAECVSTVTTL